MTDFSILWFLISPGKMYIVAIAWLYVVLMMAVAEAMSPQGTLLGAFFTLLLYGVAPLALVLYILGTPARKRRRAREEALASAAAAPDGGSEAAGDAVAPVGKEP
jgi:membrane protein implicated in regulation of membrane protease activity